MTTRDKRSHNGDGHRKRLKERFLKNGLQGFHDYEVLELLLSLNTPRKDCKQSAKHLLNRFKSFQAVLEADVTQLSEIKGVGPANSLGIRLIKEVSDRYLERRIHSKDVVSNPEELKAYLDHIIGHKNKELFAAVFLDAKNKVVASEILFQGTLTSSSVYPREVVEATIRHHAAAVIFAHNHPSGDVEPSESDKDITKKLVIALGFSGIIVHEHMIVGSDGVYSFAASGLIKKYNKVFEQLK